MAPLAFNAEAAVAKSIVISSATSLSAQGLAVLTKFSAIVPSAISANVASIVKVKSKGSASEPVDVSVQLIVKPVLSINLTSSASDIETSVPSSSSRIKEVIPEAGRLVQSVQSIAGVASEVQAPPATNITLPLVSVRPAIVVSSESSGW